MPRPAVPSDLPGIAALYHSVWHETFWRLMPAEEVARRTVPFFVGRMSRLLATTLVAVLLASGLLYFRRTERSFADVI